MALYDSLICFGRTVLALCAIDKKAGDMLKGRQWSRAHLAEAHETFGSASGTAGTLPWSVAGSDGCLKITYWTCSGESMNNVQTRNTRL
jgi:hypothetical protein